MLKKLIALSLLSLSIASLQAQQPPTQPTQEIQPVALKKSPDYYAMPYGLITLEQAKKIGDTALNHGLKNGWFLSIAIVDYSGNLVYFVRADNNQIGSVKSAISKAKSSALFKRPTKTFEDALAAGGRGLRVQSLPGAVAAEGGIPIIIDGKVLGAIGVSGDLSSNDVLAAEAGLEVLKK